MAGLTNAEPVRIGLVGCGDISAAYLATLRDVPDAVVVSCSDLDSGRARQVASAFGIGKICDAADLIASPEVELVLNLTVPAAHAGLTAAAIRAGKHVYSEKPVALTRDQGRAVLARAREAGVLIGGAPDTFLGAGIQTCRSLVDSGAIGTPVGASLSFLWPGHESWHPRPAFYYQPGGGPLFDMGPYYLTALVCLFGPAVRVSGLTSQARRQRMITSQPLAGTLIDVSVPTHAAGIIEFGNGVIATITTSFDVAASTLPSFEVHGTEASIAGPDPTGFGGPVLLGRRAHPGEEPTWTAQPLVSSFEGAHRGLGVWDLARAIRGQREPRASGELALHVLDIMLAVHESAETRAQVDLTTSCSRPQTPDLQLLPPR